MELLTQELEESIPALYATEDTRLKDKVVVAKFFDPCGSYTFYIIEGGKEEDDYIFWGLVTGLQQDEFGYSSLKEIQSVKGPFGLGIERDLYWRPRKVSEINEINPKVYTFKE